MELQQSFDTELFIDEVEKRRAIWDFESEDYKNRVLKRSAWVELVDLFFEKDATVEQKKIYGKWFLVNPGEVDIIFFCLSLYKELKRVPQHVRIRTKIQLLEVIQRAQDIHTQPQAYAPTPHNPPYNRNPYSQGPSTTGYALQRTAHNFMNPQVPVSHNFNKPHPTQATSPTDSVMSQESLMELYE
ncbi:uncharacterized protein LOC124370748 [Homalodisca vitripennis]|uniref:uncharacterized protein LOC124370748 n=1 Tax=Homalodisca vitripennis TaxID=197043 RepID=UPI001EEB5E79|nr:uncharacterized protein LOC124370748 [Homalodisca vitripennis]